MVPLLFMLMKPTRMVSPLSTVRLGAAFSDSAWSAGTRQIQSTAPVISWAMRASGSRMTTNFTLPIFGCPSGLSLK